jgi:predicted nucleic acid-binding protein
LSTYVDTSVIVSFFIRDDQALKARAWAASGARVVLSDWTLTEFTSALSHQVRLGALTDRERADVETAFDRWKSRLVVLEVGRDRFDEARGLMRVHRRLRAPDALHLAIALSSGLALATADHDMRDAAIAEGMAVVDL